MAVRAIEKREIEQDGILGRLWQATAVGTNCHSYFTHPLWLPDSSGLVFASDRTGTRDCHLLEWPSGRITRIGTGEGGGAVVSSDGRSVLYVSGECIVRKEIWGDDRQAIASLPGGVVGCGQVGQSCDGRYLLLCCKSDRVSVLLRIPRGGGDATAFHQDDRHLSHLIPSPAHPGLMSVAWTLWECGETNQRLWTIGIHGGHLEPLYHQQARELVTHEAWSGDGRIAFTSGPFDRRPNTFAVKSIDPLTGRVQLLATNGNFWHCCPNVDCSLVVADTNWPDEGIKLIEAGLSEVGTLCYSRSKAAHAHPCFSPDGAKVLFTSDASGSAQIYVAELP